MACGLISSIRFNLLSCIYYTQQNRTSNKIKSRIVECHEKEEDFLTVADVLRIIGGRQPTTLYFTKVYVVYVLGNRQRAAIAGLSLKKHRKGRFRRGVICL